MEQQGNEQNNGSQGGQGGGSNFEPITSQEQLDKILGSRLERERAKFADYDGLKEKASKFDELEQASKSELQKAIERAEAAEKTASEASRSALHTRIAAEEGVPVEVIRGDTEEEARASAQKIREWRDSGSQKKKVPPPGGLKSGATGSNSQTTGKERAAAALRQLRNGA